MRLQNKCTCNIFSYFRAIWNKTNYLIEKNKKKLLLFFLYDKKIVDCCVFFYNQSQCDVFPIEELEK